MNVVSDRCSYSFTISRGKHIHDAAPRYEKRIFRKFVFSFGKQSLRMLLLKLYAFLLVVTYIGYIIWSDASPWFERHHLFTFLSIVSLVSSGSYFIICTCYHSSSPAFVTCTIFQYAHHFRHSLLSSSK